MKLLNYPEFRQTYIWDCGAKAIQSVLVYYGIDVDEADIMKYAKTNSRYGTSPENMIKVAEKYELEIDAKEMKIVELKKYLDEKIPVVLLLQAWPKHKVKNWKEHWKHSHYAVAIGYDKSKIYFEDPYAINRTYLTEKELKDRWHGMYNSSQKHYNWGLAVFGKKPDYSANKIIHMN